MRLARTRGVDGDAVLFGRAASRLATGTASRETHRRPASRPANLRSYAREWLLFRRKRGFPCAACSIAFICCGPQFRPKTLREASTSFPVSNFYVPQQQCCFFYYKQFYSFVCLEGTNLIFYQTLLCFKLITFCSTAT